MVPSDFALQLFELTYCSIAFSAVVPTRITSAEYDGDERPSPYSGAKVASQRPSAGFRCITGVPRMDFLFSHSDGELCVPGEPSVTRILRASFASALQSSLCPTVAVALCVMLGLCW
jgi:hypothetical protein